MITLTLIQGTEDWHKTRLENFTASEAPAMMGASKYMSRTELLNLKKTGVSKPVSEFTQKIFDKGHKAEEMARPIIEKLIDEELYPVTGLLENTQLLASFDGLSMLEDIAFEHKLWNEALAENVKNNVLEAHYFWQLEQQLLVSGAEKVIFVVSDGTEENMAHMWYESVPERREALIAGWKQFAKDLATHEVVAKEEKLVANEIAELPKLEVSLVGNVSNSNLVEYKTTALAFIKSINTDLQSDQDFVDADKAVKFFTKGEKELEAVKERALSDTADIKTLFDTIDELKEEMRQKRLTLSKLVKSRKEEIRSEISMKAKVEFSDLLIATSKNLKGIQITQVSADFDGVMKGKKTVESLQNAVDSEMARAKIELSEISELVRSNLDLLSGLAGDHKFLFSDYAHLVFKANDDLTNLIKSRITEHEEAEKARLEQQREQMRLEEERKAQAKVAEEEQRKAQILENDRLLKEREAQQAATAKHEEELQAQRPELCGNEFPSDEPLQPLPNTTPVAERLAKRFDSTPSAAPSLSGRAKMMEQLKFWKDEYGVRESEFNDLMNIINQHAYCEESNAA